MTRLITAACVLAVAASAPAIAAAQTCALEPAGAFRGETVRVAFTKPLTSTGVAAPTMATVTFVAPGGTSQTAPVTLEGQRGTFVVPGEIGLGDYRAEFSVGGCNLPFPVRSPVRLTMTGVSPKGVQRWDGKDKDVRFTIQGTGFVTGTPSGMQTGTDERPWTDNQLWINDELANVNWNPPGAAKCDNANVTTPQADVLDGQTIRVCHLNLSNPAANPGIFVDWKIKGSAVRVAVGQPGVQRTAPWAFRLYPWWAGGVTVTIASAVVTTLLACFVLFSVYLYKKSHAPAAPTARRFSARTALFLDPETETYSLSKLQFYLWTLAALFGYVYLVLSRLFVQGAEWPQVPDNLPAIVGIGIGTAVGAQVVTNIRGPKGSGTELPSMGDFVMSGGVVAVDRVQMLVWTLLGVGIFVTAIAQHTPTDIEKLDTIPSTLLALSGISTMGYLGGKFARKPGPVLDEVHIEPQDSDEALANASVPPPGTVDLAGALAVAQNVVLPSSEVSIKPGLDALTQAKAIVTAVKTVAQAADALPKLAAQRQIAETTAKAAADALVKVDTPQNALAAETAQRSAAAIADLETAVRAGAGTFANQPADAPRFARTITVRGRNLSPNGIFSIDGLALPFRMLKPDPLDPAARRVPEVLIPEVDNPEMAMSLRLTIDPGQLGDADRAVYDKWFQRGSATAHTVKITNLDGQQDDLSFTIPPGAAQAAGKGGAAPPNPPGGSTPPGGRP